VYLEVNDLNFSHTGNLSKTCTADGWTEMDPMEIAVYCGYNLNGTVDDVSTNCFSLRRVIVSHRDVKSF